jgi:hypothetical protein
MRHPIRNKSIGCAAIGLAIFISTPLSPATAGDPTPLDPATLAELAGTTDAGVDAAPDAVDNQEPTDSTSSAFYPPDGSLGTWSVYYVNDAGQKVYNTAARDSWWDGQCPGADGSDRYRHVKEYPRDAIHRRMVGSEAWLYCGMTQDEGSEHAFGLRKIRNQHKSQFAKYAAWEGRDWGSFMNWTVWHTVSEPQNVTNQSPVRFCYERQYVFKNPNGTQVKRTVAVVLGETGRRIMSAWPRTNGNFTCKGTPLL